MVTLQIIAIVSAGFVCAKSRARAAMSIAVVLWAGLAVGAIQWVMYLANGRGLSAISSSWLSPHSLIAMLIPDAFQETAGHGETVGLYMGVFPLLLGIIGIWKQWSDLRVRYFAWIAVMAFLVGLGPLSLFHGALSTLLRGLWVDDACRMAYLVGFAGSLLAAFGAASLVSVMDDKKCWSVLNHIFLAVLATSGAGLLLMAVGGRRQLDPGISASVVLIFLSYGVFRHTVSTQLAGRTLRGWANALIVALVLFDLHAFDRLPKDKQEVAATGTNQLDQLLSFRGAAQFLKRQAGPSRVQIAGEPPINFGATFGIETVDTQESRPDLFNTRYRATPASAQNEGPVYQDAFWKIYEIPAYPRAWMVHQAVFEASPERQLARLNTAGFDPWRTAVIAGHVSMEPARSGGGDAVSYFKSEGDRAHIEVDAASRGLLVLSQRFRPGWRAIVNGSAAPVYRVDGELCGIVLDRGYDRIVLEYTPWPLYLAWVVSAGTVFALIFHVRVLWRDLLRGSADLYATIGKERKMPGPGEG